MTRDDILAALGARIADLNTCTLGITDREHLGAAFAAWKREVRRRFRALVGVWERDDRRRGELAMAREVLADVEATEVPAMPAGVRFGRVRVTPRI